MDADLVFRTQCFVYDLLQFNEANLLHPGATRYEYYLSSFYFTEAQVKELLARPCANDKSMTISDRLQHLFENKETSTKKEHEICTAHDLAPVFQSALGIKTGFYKSRAFKRRYRQFVKRKIREAT